MKKLFVLIALASLAQVSVAADVKGDVNPAKNKVAMCVGCHGIPGYKASFPEVYRVPMLGGQSEKYIAAALNAYKKGERNTRPWWVLPPVCRIRTSPMSLPIMPSRNKRSHS